MRSGPDSKLNVREPAVKRRELEDEVVVTIRQVLLSSGSGTGHQSAT
jgi:hypothetical protein